MCATGDFIGGVRIANGSVCYTGTTPGGGFFAETFCDQGYKLESAASQRRFCQSDGDWNGTAAQCVPVPPSLTPSACRVGCIVGIVCGVIGVLLVVFLLGGFIVVYKFKGSSGKSKSRDSEEHGLTESSSHPPPGPDSLYADPNTIEHIITVTGQEYAMVDVEGKKKKQFDGRTIEHQTAPSGAIYTEVDKPKRGSSRKGEPDVVPPGSGGPNYTATAIYQNQKSDAQWQSQDPGCVGYSVVTPREHWAL